MYIKKILLGVILIGLCIAGYFAYFVYSAMLAPNTAFESDKEYIFISSNASYDDVRAILEPLLEDIDGFDALAKRKEYVHNIRAGRYAIEKGMTNNDIINTIRSKNLPVKVSFNNQTNIENLAGRISKQIEADSASLVAVMHDEVFLKANDLEKLRALQIYIPNSYEFFWNTSAEEFRGKMLKEYNKFWNTASRSKKAEALEMSKKDVMTLASIVYEESKQKEEQPRVAGVYINRLKIGMPLQADPTLKFAAYQLPKYKNTIIKRVLNVHKEINSPYNTYKNAGLPPGLITMPDISAIDAVLNYEKHKYLYFAADAQRLGYHKFAKSLAQHNINARAYQRYLTSQGINR
ncbi:endolytic transglycosylase MltG [Ichthyenterobacterium sp. W332]|uniref:Endolytic murein transglycosylase n=1 Tax=Microcosmobacter mediterraneus TaxID=3075607 RepID=A0ABU2YH67_9FLAO|nr:endolytic transglycosylase MltG [Ichthyenterobacterium sp. W332]MDT0557513.1 endolytic transglycosylase MltG [Ichthyenterobacterium sp. W332]